MIALDASALADWLLQTPRRGPAVAAEIAAARDVHTLDFASLEVASVIRRKLRAGDLTTARAGVAIDDLLTAPIIRHPASPLTQRVWQRRPTHTTYDAAYVALAETLAVPLVTTDGRLARAHGHRAEIRLVT